MSADNKENTAHITPETTMTPAINAWIYYMEDQGRSPHTIKAFASDMRLLTNYLPPDTKIGSISTTDLNNYLEWMRNDRKAPCSPKTLARRITSVKSFFRWLQNNGIVLADPAEKVLQKTVISPLPEVLTTEELDKVLETADRHRYGQNPDARAYTLISLLIYTGIKKGECLEISPNHIDENAPDGPILFVRYADPRNRYKERKISLPQDWIDAYHEYVHQYELKDNKLFPWSSRRLEYILEDIGTEAGLDGKHLSFAMCRWTATLLDYEAGIDPEKIRQKLGVSKIQWRELKSKLNQLSGSPQKE